jgi:carbon-monoxide dehydrogenase medium subunit
VVRVLRPTTLDEVLAVLRDSNEDTKVVAGGTALMLMMRTGLLFPDALVSLEDITGLDYIAIDEREVRLGGLTTLRTMERSKDLAAVLPTLTQALPLVANHRVRNRATIGGNLCEADYASDPPSILVTLECQVRLRSTRGERLVPLRDFLVDYYETTIEHDELAVEVIVPRPDARTRTHYVKYVSRTSEDRPCVGVAASLQVIDGTCRAVNVQIAGATSTPFSVPQALDDCVGQAPTDDLWAHVAHAFETEIDPIDDVRGSSAYRRQVTGRLVKRTLRGLTQHHPNGANRL